LSQRQLRSGLAEVAKHGLIAAPELWRETLAVSQLDVTPDQWRALVSAALEVKSAIVAHDPYEHAVRKILNFGHTIGHALESYYMDSQTPLLHGEAVAAGMAAEAHIAVKHAGLPPETALQIHQGLEAMGFQLKWAAKFEQLMPFMLQDKKNTQSLINFSLISDLGKCVYNCTLEVDAVRSALKDYWPC